MLAFGSSSVALFGAPAVFVIAMAVFLSLITACFVIYMFERFVRRIGSAPNVFDPDFVSGRLLAPQGFEGQTRGLGIERSAVSMIALAPFPAWQRSSDGKVIWANGAFHSLLSDIGADTNTSPLTLPSSFQITSGEEPQNQNRRASISIPNGTSNEQRWFQLCERTSDTGDIIGYALDATDVVSVESTLSRFVGTLTESFAQLSTGLAIFDADRRITMFNPAIADLLTLDPVWLASKPGLRDFMSALREKQMVPEQKTTGEWKSFIQNIEKGAVDGTLVEKWVLPSGQTFKITGRPHPHGAIALMIEDISTRVSLERKYRSEIEQSRATLDNLSEAICIFDTAGKLIYSNGAADERWGFRLSSKGSWNDIVSITSKWSSLCDPNPVWGDLREFVTSMDQRASWHADINLLAGGTVQAVFAPLPDGSTLTAFGQWPSDDLREEVLSRQSQERDISILELAVEHMKVAVNLAKNSLEQDEVVDPSFATGQAKMAAAINLSDQLLMLRKSEELDKDQSEGPMSADIAACLAEKGAKLNLSCSETFAGGEPSPDLKRLLLNIGLVVRTLVLPGENVDLSIAPMVAGVSVSCSFRTSKENAASVQASAGIPYRIMKRFVQERNGEEALIKLGNSGLVKISCTLPVRKREKLERLEASA